MAAKKEVDKTKNKKETKAPKEKKSDKRKVTSVQDMRKQYLEHKMKVLTGEEKNTAFLKELRKNIARALTTQKQQNLVQETNG